MKTSTIERYRSALEDFRNLCLAGKPISVCEFARERGINAGFGKLIREAGFICRTGYQQYVWLKRPITTETIKDLARNNQQYDRPRTSANDETPVQAALDLQPRAVQKPGRIAVLENQVDELSKRVASLEQLLIRRGVA